MKPISNNKLKLLIFLTTNVILDDLINIILLINFSCYSSHFICLDFSPLLFSFFIERRFFTDILNYFGFFYF